MLGDSLRGAFSTLSTYSLDIKPCDPDSVMLSTVQLKLLLVAVQGNCAEGRCKEGDAASSSCLWPHRFEAILFARSLFDHLPGKTSAPRQDSTAPPLLLVAVQAFRSTCVRPPSASSPASPVTRRQAPNR